MSTGPGKRLREARWILIGVGALTISINAIVMVVARYRITEPDLLQFLSAETALIAMGCLFIVFGLIVQRYPVAITITSLVIFLGMVAILAAMDPTTLAQGWLVKIVLVGALVKALQAALADVRREAPRVEA